MAAAGEAGAWMAYVDGDVNAPAHNDGIEGGAARRRRRGGAAAKKTAAKKKTGVKRGAKKGGRRLRGRGTDDAPAEVGMPADDLEGGAARRGRGKGKGKTTKRRTLRGRGIEGGALRSSSKINPTISPSKMVSLSKKLANMGMSRTTAAYLAQRMQQAMKKMVDKAADRVEKDHRQRIMPADIDAIISA